MACSVVPAKCSREVEDRSQAFCAWRRFADYAGVSRSDAVMVLEAGAYGLPVAIALAAPGTPISVKHSAWNDGKQICRVVSRDEAR
jgi:hypothetical protein